MHNMDRTYMETEFDHDHDHDHEFQFQGNEAETLSEADVHEMAAELLGVTNEQELDHFLGGLISKVGSAIGSVVRSPVGRAVGGALRDVARQALPGVAQQAGQAIGGRFFGPQGAQIGGRIGDWLGQKGASWLGGLFELDLEGMSEQDAEFEVAKQFVRLAADTVKNAVAAPAGANPAQVAQQALTQAAQQFAPGLLKGGTTVATATGSPLGAATGRWVRRGKKIILYGI